MKIINPYTEILTPLDGQAILQHIELCGRVCYKSEDKITDTSAAKFVAGIIKLRTAPAAHPQMREVAIPLLHQMRSQVPVIFDDIEEAAHETL